MGQYVEAEQIILINYGELNEKLEAEHPRTKNAIENLVQLYEASGGSGRAETYRALNAG